MITTNKRLISETEFSETLKQRAPQFLHRVPHLRFVTGPGRSGALMSVYMSHYFSMNFVPYGQLTDNENVLVVDTAMLSGRTIRKAARLYNDADTFVLYTTKNRVKFWYEL